jgi:glycosyltransferase involved in cell wall biosynthesis
MQLLAVVPSIPDISPGQRYRIEQWEPILNKLGVEITYAPFDSVELNQTLHSPGANFRKLSLLAESFGRRFRLMKSLKNYDLVYVFREATLFGPAFFERLIHQSGLPFVFDFDDAIFESYKSPSNGYLSYLKFAAKTKRICRMASHVIVGNPYLAEYAEKFNDHVTIVPSTIDTDKYTATPRPDSHIPVIGWTGSFSTVQHLNTLRSVLGKLARQRPFRLRIIGTTTYELEGVDVEVVPWRSSSEVEDLRPIDVGIMPLPDDEWTRGKCGMKALQFMALGLPVVCSPVGVNTDIIQDGVNGFLAKSDDEWIQKLDQLLASSELRQRLGAAARVTVESGYSSHVHAPRVFEVFQSVVRQRQRQKQVARESHPTQVHHLGK